MVECHGQLSMCLPRVLSSTRWGPPKPAPAQPGPQHQRTRKAAQKGFWAADRQPCEPQELPLSSNSPSHLQHQHAVRVAQNLVRLRVVAVADVGGGHKQAEGVLLLGVQQAALQGGQQGGREGS